MTKTTLTKIRSHIRAGTIAEVVCEPELEKADSVAVILEKEAMFVMRKDDRIRVGAKLQVCIIDYDGGKFDRRHIAFAYFEE